MAFNPLYLLATATFGLGFSLAIYRPVASRVGWPMGVMQRRFPFIVMLLGLAALVMTFLFIMGDTAQRWPVLLLGLLFALFWVGFMRVASQTALFLTPIAGLLFGMVWASTEEGVREIRSLDDRLLDRATKIEQRLEDRLRNVLERARRQQSGTAVEEPAAAPAPAGVPAKKTP